MIICECLIPDIHQDDYVVEPVAVLDRGPGHLVAGHEARAAGEPREGSDLGGAFEGRFKLSILIIVWFSYC